MANVYVKSFARPFYLDRCLRTIEQNLTGRGRVIVLDDGTPSTHLALIAERHPGVEIRSSGADDGKMGLLRAEKFDEIARQYPSAPEFWVREIAKDDGDYCIVMEDDAWLCRHVDVPAMRANLVENDAVLGKFWWPPIPHQVTARFRGEGCPNLEYFQPQYDSLANAASIWIVAFAMFRKDYWLYCVAKARRLADERSQLAAACEFTAANLTARFAKTETRTVYQGWAVPARSTPEYYERGLKQHLYMDALSQAWADGRLDALADYPYDFSRETIMAALRAYLPEEIVCIWEEWHRKEITYFYD